jgi:membrane protein YdbS with pleckstrin-like domain
VEKEITTMNIWLIIAIVVVVLLLIAFLFMLPDVRRYRRLRTM